MMQRFVFVFAALAFGLLASCAPEYQPPSPQAPSVPATPIFSTSFICQDGNTPVQNAVCGNQQLAALDLQMAALFRQHMGTDSLFERDQVMAMQRAWLLGLPAACNVTATASPTAVSCLATAYQAQIAALTNWPAPLSGTAGESAAIAHYVQYKLLDAKQPALCASLSAGAAAAMGRDGAIDPSRLDGAQEIAGTHGSPSGVAPQGGSVSVDVYQSGLYGGYQTRARSVTMAGAATPVLIPSSVGAYVETLPNGGGRFGNFASQTNDYGSVDVFTLNGQLVALLTEVIGYNSPAPPGETSDTALYTLSQNAAAPACLFETYTMPPPLTQGTFSAQPSLTPFLALIDSIEGTPPENLAQSDLQDTVYLTAETRWMLFNMPLVVVAQNRDGNWTGFLRHRHDQVLDALFAWSHQSPANLAQFTQLFNLLRPAAIDMDTIYVQQQGLSAADAEQATSLAMMELLWQATAYTAPGLGGDPASPESYQTYKPRYPILANPQS